MIEIQTLSSLSRQEYKNLLYRSSLNLDNVISGTIEPLAQAFRNHSYQALSDAAERFDGGLPQKPILTAEDLESAYNTVKSKSPEIIEAFEKAKENIQAFHEKQTPHGYQAVIADNTLGFRFQPFDRVALYVPGGKALYPSTVLMGVLPAKIAGVKDILLLSPPEKQTGRINDVVAAIAHMAGVTRLLQAGGAQSILAAAYGVEELSIEPVDFIYGPGNIFVAAAKTYAFSKNLCGIDSFAGPSEVLIIADESANPHYLAHDLLAQAEHDEDAIAIMLTTSQKTVDATVKAIEEAIASREDEEARKKIMRESIMRNGKIFLAKDLEEAVAFSNDYAPEHLEIQTTRNNELLSLITAAGSIFAGDFAPVAAGDYYTGTNHILPTGRAARYSSGVSVHTFYRRITWQTVTQEGLQAGADAIATMSRVENLFAEHGYSVLARFGEKQ